MRVAMFSVHAFDRDFFDEANAGRRHELHYLETRLTPATATLARDFPAVCAFVNDQLSADVLTILASGGTRMIALRSAAFNHVDLRKAQELAFTVARVPAYSPHAVAEHTIGLMLALDRKIHRAYARVLVLRLHGTEIEWPLAVVMIGGLATSTLFTLLVLPTFYLQVHGWLERRASRSRAEAA